MSYFYKVIELFKALWQSLLDLWAWAIDFLKDQETSTLLGSIAAIVGLLGTAYGVIKWLRSKRYMKLRRKTTAELHLNKVQSAFDEAQYEDAARLADETILWAKDVGDTALERKAHIRASIALDWLFVSQHHEEVKRSRIIEQISAHLDDAERLGERKASILLLRARLARLEQKPEDILRYADQAEQSSEKPEDKGEALVVRMQAYWQMKQPERALELEETIKAFLAGQAGGDNQLVVHGTWLRSLCKAGRVDENDVANFVSAVEVERENADFSALRILQLLGEIAGEFSQRSKLKECVTLLELAERLCAAIDDPVRCVSVSLQLGELHAALGEGEDAMASLNKADRWLEKLKTRLEGQTKEKWANLKGISLFTRGRVHNRLSERPDEGMQNLEGNLLAADEAFTAALIFVDEHSAELTGDVSYFAQELRWWRGRNNMALGRFAEAVTDFRKSRPDGATVLHAARGRLVDTYIGEAEAMMLNGQAVQAFALVEEVISANASGESGKRAVSLQNYLKHRIIPVSDWLSGDEAREISAQVALDGLKSVVAAQAEPLVGWWETFQTDDGRQANSEMFDIWGRGALSRIIAAVRAQPANAIMVDATSVNEIARWCRLLCPFYETVIVKWKGALEHGLAIVPMPDYLGPRGTFGGQGYVRTSDAIDKEGYHAAIGWANMMPTRVSSFLATEAMPLIQSGRLVVLPAALVGCTQKAVGWTDNLLADGHLRGVTCVARKSDKAGSKETATHRRIIDHADIAIPFIDRISLTNLDAVLDETIEWTGDMRRLLKSSLGSDGFRQENWEALSPIFNDLREAGRAYKERLASLHTKSDTDDWCVSETISSLSTLSADRTKIGSESVTQMLRAIASENANLGPWIPFWRLYEAGGQVNWSGALDNPSYEPDAGARAQLAMQGAEPMTPQSWIYPGSGGPGMATAFMM